MLIAWVLGKLWAFELVPLCYLRAGFASYLRTSKCKGLARPLVHHQVSSLFFRKRVCVNVRVAHTCGYALPCLSVCMSAKNMCICLCLAPIVANER